MRIRNAALTSSITTARAEMRELSPPPCREPGPKRTVAAAKISALRGDACRKGGSAGLFRPAREKTRGAFALGIVLRATIHST